MSWRSLLAIAALTLAACGGGTPIATDDLSVRIVTGQTDVEFGVGFPLTVVRSWRTTLEPAPWDDATLDPLTTRLVEVSHRESGDHAEETRRYECHAFVRDLVVLKPRSFSARSKSGSQTRETTSNEIRLNVRSSLPPGAPGEIELPSGLMAERSPWTRGLLAGIAGVCALGFVAWTVRRRQKPPPAAVAPVGPTPEDRARSRLLQLRTHVTATREDVQAFTIEVSSLVRDFVEERFHVRALEMTTQEFLSSPATARVLGAPQRTLLGEFLALCDRIKFGRHLPGDTERSRLLDSAETFLNDAASAAGTEGPRA